MNDKLARLAKGQYGNMLIEVLRDVQDQVADLRTIVKVKPEVEREVRLATIELIDSLLIQRLQVLAGELAPPNPNEHE